MHGTTYVCLKEACITVFFQYVHIYIIIYKHVKRQCSKKQYKSVYHTMRQNYIKH